MDKYYIVSKGGEGEITEKKSRFIAHVLPVESEEEALLQIENIKKKYWDARHNCFAFIMGKKYKDLVMMVNLREQQESLYLRCLWEKT